MEQGDPCMPPPSILDDPSPIGDMITKIKIDADWVGRRQAVDAFNAVNMWKKRGISLVPMRYPHLLSGFGLKMNCLISIFGMDGTISVAHNGIEMGQGMNTKVVQCVAHTLGVPMELIQCKPVTAVTNPNGMVTGGSCGSESNCVAAIAAAEMLKVNCPSKLIRTNQPGKAGSCKGKAGSKSNLAGDNHGGKQQQCGPVCPLHDEC